jgi:hypothetical protein
MKKQWNSILIHAAIGYICLLSNYFFHLDVQRGVVRCTFALFPNYRWCRETVFSWEICEKIAYMELETLEFSYFRC